MLSLSCHQTLNAAFSLLASDVCALGCTWSGDKQTPAFWLNTTHSILIKNYRNLCRGFLLIYFVFLFFFFNSQSGTDLEDDEEKEKRGVGSFDVSSCTTHSCFCRCPLRVSLSLKYGLTLLLSVWAWTNIGTNALSVITKPSSSTMSNNIWTTCRKLPMLHKKRQSSC